MAVKRRKPRVYLDTSCIGRLVDRDSDARDAMLALLASINLHQLEFVDSAWLDTELRRTEPRSDRDRLLKSVPDGIWVQWDSSIARDAANWAILLGLEDDESGVADCRHLECAFRGDADVLVTHDNRFFEAMKQHARLIKPLKPSRLIGWQEVVYGD